jgi:endogenous inhibitor of DNA gyrase (YacG/DUF329 family)
MSAVQRCPTCKRPRKPSPENPAFPFCSGRCKLADLSNWLEGRYSLEAEPAFLDEGAEARGPTNDPEEPPNLH